MERTTTGAPNPRQHARLLGPSAALVKELRANLRPFVQAVRTELGIVGDLAPEPEG